MLETLDEGFTLFQSQPPATPAEIEAFTSRFPDAPREYLDLVKEATEIELGWGAGKYLRIWGPDGCVEMDEAYEVGLSIPGAIPIGDNGGGVMLVYLNGDAGWGLYRVSYGDIDPASALLISPTLSALLTQGFGIEKTV